MRCSIFFQIALFARILAIEKYIGQKVFPVSPSLIDNFFRFIVKINCPAMVVLCLPRFKSDNTIFKVNLVPC